MTNNTDLISREQAIEAIKHDIMGGLNYESILQRLPSVTHTPCEDAISRQAAIDVIAETDITNGTEPVFTGKQVQALLRDLPPVHPIRPSVIEDIKAEIKQKREENRNGEYDKIFELCLLIIDKYTSGKEQA